ncbi:methylenetetrahydrofolate reductase [NAD(P)H] [Botrimarina sp.]|uniref:methylenetetrahydrofolate reductase [NAD(P)H] n=1 Tax=Botrimarina sp. TaxID=2795802 RepID=UPI0032ED9232
MRLPEIYAANPFALSFELFPPKTDKGADALFRHAERLVEFKPSYLTCTYGAGGSTQDSTLNIAARLRRQFGLPVATHLTCVGRTADQIRDYLRRAIDADVQNVVALRGDPPKGESKFTATEGGFAYANELVAMIRSDFPEMGVAVGGYPEVHQEAPSAEVDLDNLKRKVDAGAHAIITQLFYDNEDFFRFRDQCESAGVKVPLIPGLLPVTNVSQIKKIASLCGARLPERFLADLESCGGDADRQFEVGVRQATDQTQQLVDAGVPGIHYYVLNKSEAAVRVLTDVRL